jgi:hypothetical protein
MAGVSGRSGGSNRVGGRLHQLRGTTRKDRAPRPPAGDVVGRLADLHRLYAFHKTNVRHLHGRLRTIRRGKDAQASESSLQREARHQAALLVQLGAAIDRLEAHGITAPADVDDFAQFDKFDGRAQ